MCSLLQNIIKVGRRYMSWEKNIWEWRVIYRGLWDVIWKGRGRPTVRVSLGQSPARPHTKKHFCNCQLMAAVAELEEYKVQNAAARSTTTCACTNGWWSRKTLRAKKRWVCMKKLQNKTWQRTQPCFAATGKIKSIKSAIITAATRECTYLGP